MQFGFFTTVFYQPLYNGLVALINLIPGHNAGLAVILLTIIIRIILYPLSKSSIKTQLQMKQIEPEVSRVKAQYKDSQEQARQMLKLYKENDIHPFSGFFLVLIQLPILIEMYQVFRSGLPAVDPVYLYSFVSAPAAGTVSMVFLGISLVGKSYILAILAAVTQFIQMQVALPKVKRNPGDKSFQADFAQSMNVQMKYVFPALMLFIGLISPVLSLYFITSNIFMTLQEIFVKRRLKAKLAAKN